MEAPNPYKPPEAPVDPHGDVPSPHSLRVLLRALLLVQVAVTVISMALPDTLPPDLARARDAASFGFFTRYPALPIAALALIVAGLLGLCWEKRWAVWTYVAGNALGYAIELIAGPSISSELTTFVDSANDLLVGATLVVLYLGGYLSSRRGTEAR